MLDAFLVSLAGLLLVGNGLADRFGRRRVFLCGLVGFAVASVLAAASQAVGEVIASRALMGAAAACVMPPALSLVAVLFPPELRPKAAGIWSAVGGLGLALGPVVGGALVDLAGWRWVFLVNVPFALLAVPLGLRWLPESRRPGVPPLDIPGVVLSTVALTGIVFALIEGVDAGWTNPAVLAAAALGIAAGVAFFAIELRRPPSAVRRARARPPARRGGRGGHPRRLHRDARDDVPAPAVRAVRAGRLGVRLGPGGRAVRRRPGRLRAAERAARREVRHPQRHARRAAHRDGGLRAAAASVRRQRSRARRARHRARRLRLRRGVPAGDRGDPQRLGAEKAGDGAAVNQLARQVGGALGVAVVGTVFAAIYAAEVISAGRVPTVAKESIEDATDAASRWRAWPAPTS